MDRFDDVSVVASVDESPPPPRRVPRRTRRAFTVGVASVVATAALAGAAVGLADEKAEPSASSGSAAESFPVFKRSGRECRRGEGRMRSSSGSSLRY